MFLEGMSQSIVVINIMDGCAINTYMSSTYLPSNDSTLAGCLKSVNPYYLFVYC